MNDQHKQTDKKKNKKVMIRVRSQVAAGGFDPTPFLPLPIATPLYGIVATPLYAVVLPTLR